MDELTKLYYELEGLKELGVELREELLNTPLYKRVNKVEERLVAVKEKLHIKKRDVLKELLVSLGYECRTNHKLEPTLCRDKAGHEEPDKKYTYVIIHKDRPSLISIREITKCEDQDEPFLEGIQTKWEKVEDTYIHYSDTWLERSGIGIVGYGFNEEQAWDSTIEWLLFEYGIYSSDNLHNVRDSLKAESRLHTILQLLLILPLNVRQELFVDIVKVYISNSDKRDLIKELILSLPQDWVIKELYRIDKELLIDELYPRELDDKSFMIKFITGERNIS